jgi:hypothetical protein
MYVLLWCGRRAAGLLKQAAAAAAAAAASMLHHVSRTAALPQVSRSAFHRLPPFRSKGHEYGLSAAIHGKAAPTSAAAQQYAMLRSIVLTCYCVRAGHVRFNILMKCLGITNTNTTSSSTISTKSDAPMGTTSCPAASAGMLLLSCMSSMLATS